VTLINSEQRKVVLDKPSVIFFAKATKHTLMAEQSHDAELICASVHYGIGRNNALTSALPDMLILPIEQMPFLQTNIEWLLDEADKDNQGRQAIMNRLMEIFIINILRSLIESEQLRNGMLAGLVHPQLSKVLHQIHNAPEEHWSLAKMADIAAMSRAKFADVFKDVLGQPPNDYLTQWRVSVAQALLVQGKNVTLVANSVGYETASALSRVFRKKTGYAPKEWLAQR
jgi:AraC-like DNA-binding protein